MTLGVPAKNGSGLVFAKKEGDKEEPALVVEESLVASSAVRLSNPTPRKRALSIAR